MKKGKRKAGSLQEMRKRLIATGLKLYNEDAQEIFDILEIAENCDKYAGAINSSPGLQADARVLALRVKHGMEEQIREDTKDEGFYFIPLTEEYLNLEQERKQKENTEELEMSRFREGVAGCGGANKPTVGWKTQKAECPYTHIWFEHELLSTKGRNRVTSSMLEFSHDTIGVPLLLSLREIKLSYFTKEGRKQLVTGNGHKQKLFPAVKEKTKGKGKTSNASKR